MSYTEAIDTPAANFYLCDRKEKNGGTKENKGSAMAQAQWLLQLMKRHISG